MEKENRIKLKFFLRGISVMGILMSVLICFMVKNFYSVIRATYTFDNIPRIIYLENFNKYLMYNEKLSGYDGGTSYFKVFDSSKINENNEYFKIKNQVNLIFSGFESKDEGKNYSNKCLLENEIKKYTDKNFTILNVMNDIPINGTKDHIYYNYKWVIDFDGEVPINDLKNIPYLEKIEDVYNRKKAIPLPSND